jgi:hypothetical protein
VCTRRSRYGRRCCLRRQRCGGADGCDHGYAAADEIGRERRKAIGLIFRPAVFHRNVLALDIAGFFQGVEEPNHLALEVVISGSGAKKANHRLGSLLRAGRKRPRGRARNPCDELPPSHWIT